MKPGTHTNLPPFHTLSFSYLSGFSHSFLGFLETKPGGGEMGGGGVSCNDLESVCSQEKGTEKKQDRTGEEDKQRHSFNWRAASFTLVPQGAHEDSEHQSVDPP